MFKLHAKDALVEQNDCSRTKQKRENTNTDRGPLQSHIVEGYCRALQEISYDDKCRYLWCGKSFNNSGLTWLPAVMFISQWLQRPKVLLELTGLWCIMEVLLLRLFFICCFNAVESNGLSSSKLHSSSPETLITAPQLSNSPQYCHPRQQNVSCTKSIAR